MPKGRSFASPDSIVGNLRQRRGKETRGTKHVSTVSSRGGPKRTLTYQGTPVSTKGIAPSKAPSRAIQVQKALERVQKAYSSGPRYGKTFDPDEAASLVKSVGGSTSEARALSTKILGESGGRPKAVGHDPGGTTGLGLWQMTTGVGNDDLIAKHGGPKAMLKPKPNAKAALELYRGGGIDNWYAPSNPPGEPKKVPPKVKPDPKDEKTLIKAGIDARRPSSPSNHKPFKGAAKGTKAAKIINPKWDPDSDGHGETFLAKGISKAVKKWSNRYNVQVGEAKAESGHVSPGHLVTGTATDVYPQENTEAGWDKLEKGLAILGKQGFEVGYDGSVPGTQNWSNHGRGNHAHIEWVGQGSDPSAIKKLAGLTDAQIRAMERGAGGGGGIAGTSGTGTSGGITPKANVPDKEKKLSPKEKLARIRAKYGETTTSSTSPSSSLRRKYGSPVV